MIGDLVFQNGQVTDPGYPYDTGIVLGITDLHDDGKICVNVVRIHASIRSLNPEGGGNLCTEQESNWYSMDEFLKKYCVWVNTGNNPMNTWLGDR